MREFRRTRLRSTHEILARHALGQDRATYLTHRDESIGQDESERLEAMVRRREGREPVAYILGEREFWGLSFLVSPAVLIPRPETEAIVEKALALMDDAARAWRLADVGTGSGCLAIALARERVNANVIATDISEPALGIAAANAVRHGVDARIRLIRTSTARRCSGAIRSHRSQPAVRARKHARRTTA